VSAETGGAKPAFVITGLDPVTSIGALRKSAAFTAPTAKGRAHSDRRPASPLQPGANTLHSMRGQGNRPETQLR
jgi:hypothetical protein